MELIELTRNRGAACDQLLRSLPEWFGIESSIRDYVREVEQMRTLAVCDDGLVVGFLALRPHNDTTMEIHVMAVHPDYHRRGIGAWLIHRAEEELREEFEYLVVKTVAASHPSPEYAQTRKFYEAVGFRPLQELSIWGPGNPCLLMIKKL